MRLIYNPLNVVSGKLNEHVNNEEIHITADDRSKWDNAADKQDVDLSNYATKADVQDTVTSYNSSKNYITEIPSTYTTDEELEAKLLGINNSIEDMDLSNYYTKDEINSLGATYLNAIIGASYDSATGLLTLVRVNGQNTSFYIKGANGSASITKLVYAAAESVPATPTGGSYDFSTNVFTLPSGTDGVVWSEARSLSGDIYMSQRIFYSDGTESTWSTPMLISGSNETKTTEQISASHVEVVYHVGSITKAMSSDGKYYYKTVAPSMPTGGTYDFDLNKMTVYPHSIDDAGDLWKESIDDTLTYTNDLADNYTEDTASDFQVKYTWYFSIGTIGEGEDEITWTQPAVYGIDYTTVASSMKFIAIDYSVLAEHINITSDDISINVDNAVKVYLDENGITAAYIADSVYSKWVLDENGMSSVNQRIISGYDYTDVEAKKEEVLAALNSYATSAQEKYDLISGLKNDVDSEITDLSSYIASLKTAADTKCNELYTELQAIKDLYDVDSEEYQDALGKYQQEVAALTAQMEAYEGDLNTYLQSLKDTQDKLDLLAKDYETALGNAGLVSATIKSLGETLTGYQTKINEIAGYFDEDGKFTILEANYSSLRQDYDAIVADVAQWKQLQSSGIQSVVEQYCNSWASSLYEYYLDEDGTFVKAGDTIIEITEDNESDYPVESYPRYARKLKGQISLSEITDEIGNNSTLLQLIADKVEVNSGLTTFTGDVLAKSLSIMYIGSDNEYHTRLKWMSNYHLDPDGMYRKFIEDKDDTWPVCVLFDEDGVDIIGYNSAFSAYSYLWYLSSAITPYTWGYCSRYGAYFKTGTSSKTIYKYPSGTSLYDGIAYITRDDDTRLLSNPLSGVQTALLVRSYTLGYSGIKTNCVYIDAYLYWACMVYCSGDIAIGLFERHDYAEGVLQLVDEDEDGNTMECFDVLMSNKNYMLLCDKHYLKTAPATSGGTVAGRIIVDANGLSVSNARTAAKLFYLTLMDYADEAITASVYVNSGISSGIQEIYNACEKMLSTVNSATSYVNIVGVFQDIGCWILEIENKKIYSSTAWNWFIDYVNTKHNVYMSPFLVSANYDGSQEVHLNATGSSIPSVGDVIGVNTGFIHSVHYYILKTSNKVLIEGPYYPLQMGYYTGDDDIPESYGLFDVCRYNGAAPQNTSIMIDK